MSAASAALLRLDPDVLLLQEVRNLESAERLVAPLEGFAVHVVSRFPEGFGAGPGRQQVAIAARLPAESAWSEPWRAGRVDPPRGLAFAVLAHPGGSRLLAYSVHLKSNLGDAVKNIAKREESARQLLAHIEAMRRLHGDLPVVVGGDWNTWPGRDPNERTAETLVASGMRWSFAGVPGRDRVTWPARDGYPDACFDYFMTLGLEAQPGWVPGGDFSAISDHRPVGIDVFISTDPGGRTE